MPDTNLRRLGRIVHLQIQRSALKLGEKPNRYYDPSALLRVDELMLTAEGVLVRLPDSASLLDVHHTAHPASRNSSGANDISIGFTRHYAAMRARFGEHLVDGVAGENILVETESAVALAAVTAGVAMAASLTGNLVWLRQVRVAVPCREFSGYAARSAEPEAIKGALQFLDDGRRGYYCGFEGPGTAAIAVGDEVWALG